MRKSGDDDIGGDVAKDAKTNLFYCKVTVACLEKQYLTAFTSRTEVRISHRPGWGTLITSATNTKVLATAARNAEVKDLALKYW